MNIEFHNQLVVIGDNDLQGRIFTNSDLILIFAPQPNTSFSVEELKKIIEVMSTYKG